MPDEKPIERRFIFNGSAVAFAGRIRRPDDKFIKAAASSHLPVTGGLSEAVIEGTGIDQYQYKDFITFKKAHSRAQGDFSDPRQAVQFTHGNHGQNVLPANTAVEAQLEGLVIDAPAVPEHKTPRQVFEALTLHVHMESTTNRRDPISFRSLSAVFDGITLRTGMSAAVGLKVHTATEIFSENDTKAKLIETYAKDGDFRKKFAACFYPAGAQLPGLLSNLMGKHEIPYAKGIIVATFVTKLEWMGTPPEGSEILNNRLTIPGLGRIYFGEIVIEENNRRPTLLRFELGCLHGGEAAACEVGSNGGEYPPVL